MRAAWIAVGVLGAIGLVLWGSGTCRRESRLPAPDASEAPQWVPPTGVEGPAPAPKAKPEPKPASTAPQKSNSVHRLAAGLAPRDVPPAVHDMTPLTVNKPEVKPEPKPAPEVKPKPEVKPASESKPKAEVQSKPVRPTSLFPPSRDAPMYGFPLRFRLTAPEVPPEIAEPSPPRPVSKPDGKPNTMPTPTTKS